MKLSREEEGKKTTKNKKGKVAKRAAKFFFRSVFVLVLLFFFAVAGLGLNAVVSCIKEAPEFDPQHFQQPLTSYIYNIHGEEVTRLHDGHNRIEVPLSEIPKDLQHAFVSIEDERFYEHIGVSVKDIGRALINNLRQQRLIDHGGSTITQQLIKNTILTPERTFRRKIQEAWLAIKMEQEYSKDEIMEFYLNIIYFDQLAYGVEAAAQTYFGKNVSDLTLAESAMLAGIPRSPSNYSPRRDFDAAKMRQELVLNKMVECGYITRQEAMQAKTETIELADPPQRTYKYPYFIDYVEREAKEILEDLDIYEDPEIALNRGGLKIYTTLEPEIQENVENIVNQEEFYPVTLEDEEGKLQPQSAAVLAEPDTGHLKALVGGRDYGLHNQSLRFLSTRQPGSAIKPVLAYAPAIEEGIIFPGTIIHDVPTTFGNYTPRNYDRAFMGPITMREALYRSRNVPAVKAYDQISPQVGINYAQRLGITSITDRDIGGLSLVLGGFTYGTRPIDMAQAFGVFANQGVKTPLTSILEITDAEGNTLYRYKPTPESVIKETTAFLITDVLKDVSTRGTASRLYNEAGGRPIASKTGTTSDNRDVWLVSYTPDYVLSTWMGYDVQEMGKIDSTAWPRRMSGEIMRQVHEELPVKDFERPGGLIQTRICSISGKLAGEHCPSEGSTSDWYPREHAPNNRCDIHITMEVCSVTGLLPTDFCPELEERSFVKIPEGDDRDWSKILTDRDKLAPTETCDVHTDRPTAPVGLRLNSSASGNEVYLSWNYTEGPYQGFNVYRQTNGEERIKLNDDLITAQAFRDENTSPGKTYQYEITAINEGGIESLPLLGTITTNDPDTSPDGPPGEDNGENNNGQPDNREDNGGNGNNNKPPNNNNRDSLHNNGDNKDKKKEEN
ncbi:MAG: PBP1A family penicillin-binding protein [Candidatus Syntrophonatronum acetioxidans]|uniref:Penicillin-binding protein 1A n=1 Tax=Candidatus Syntrophonatronum acetioxidans TaxID=1795816 RepID=A0A424YGX2_9FIRM|nr:MAG: PBP1A family penicillin-binding protein [Candidatus Syntrophonatronum acetioxidans]